MGEPSRHSLTWIFVLGLGVLAVLLAAAIWGGLIGVSREGAQLDGSQTVPAWAHVAPEQIAEAEKYGVPVAFENDLGMRFVLIPAGTFMMGSPEDEVGHFPEFETQHEVSITKPYYMQITEVTVEQYRKKKPWPPAPFTDAARGAAKPVTLVSWNDAKAFAAWLTVLLYGRRLYDLPTEAQWERACRAGTTTPFSFGATLSTNQANYDGTQPDEEDWEGVGVYGADPKGQRRDWAVDVATLGRNAWGLYDMHGNVEEWCLDWVGKYASEPVSDPCNLTEWYERICRGGSWAHGPVSCRSAARGWCNPRNQTVLIGFRLVSPLPEPAEGKR